MERKRKRQHYTVKQHIIHSLVYIELVIVALIILIPVVWIIGSSLGRSSSLASAKIIPDRPTLNNYVRLFKETKFAKWYVNTLQVAIINMIASTLISTLTAYVFSRFRFRGKKGVLMGIMVLQMFPTYMSMTAIFILYQNFGILDNLYALTLTYIAGQIPYNTWLMKGYMSGMSKSLDEAAMLDGATKLQIFTKVILPLSTPMITFVAVSTFMTPWMDYILPRLLLRSESKKTLAVGIYDLINSDTNNNYTMFASGAILVAVPIAILYMALQKYLIYGITAGGTKE